MCGFDFVCIKLESLSVCASQTEFYLEIFVNKLEWKTHMLNQVIGC